MIDSDNTKIFRGQARPRAGMSSLSDELASLFPNERLSYYIIDAGPSYTPSCKKLKRRTPGGDVGSGPR